MGEVRAITVPLFWAIVADETLLGAGVTNPGEMTGSEKEFLVSDNENGLLALLSPHGITEEEYRAMK